MIDGRDVIVAVYEADRLGIIDVFYNEMALSPEMTPIRSVCA